MGITLKINGLKCRVTYFPCVKKKLLQKTLSGIDRFGHLSGSQAVWPFLLLQQFGAAVSRPIVIISGLQSFLFSSLQITIIRYCLQTAMGITLKMNGLKCRVTYFPYVKKKLEKKIPGFTDLAI